MPGLLGSVRSSTRPAMPAGVRSSSFRWPVSGSDMAEMVGWPEAVGINEPPPGPVLGQHPGVIEAIEATKGLGKKLPGHAPGIHGTDLQAYIAAGFDADHESTTSEQA